MKFTETEIAEIYGYNLAELQAEGDSSRIGYLNGKLERLNAMDDIQRFKGDLDMRNQKSFKRVIRRKLAWALEGEV